MAEDQSIESKVFQDKYNIIRTGVLQGYRDIANRAFAKNLIVDEVHKNVTGINLLPDDMRVDSLMVHLKERIKGDPTVLEKFVQVLQEADPGVYAVQIRNISKTYIYIDF